MVLEKSQKKIIIGVVSVIAILITVGACVFAYIIFFIPELARVTVDYTGNELITKTEPADFLVTGKVNKLTNIHLTLNNYGPKECPVEIKANNFNEKFTVTDNGYGLILPKRQQYTVNFCDKSTTLDLTKLK